MSEQDLLADCLKDLTKERDHFRCQATKAVDALEQATADFDLATKLRDEAVSDLYLANDRIEQFEVVLKEWLESEDWDFRPVYDDLVDKSRQLLAGDNNP